MPLAIDYIKSAEKDILKSNSEEQPFANLVVMQAIAKAQLAQALATLDLTEAIKSLKSSISLDLENVRKEVSLNTQKAHDTLEWAKKESSKK